MIFQKTAERIKLSGKGSTFPGVLVAVCLVQAVAGFGGVLKAQEMDKAAIPRPGAERMKREAQARQAKIEERRAMMNEARERAAMALARAEGTKPPTASDVEAEEIEEGAVDGEEAAAAETEGAISAEMAALLPVGSVFKGVRFPKYDKDLLTSVVNAEEMYRIDTEHLDLTDLVVEMFREDGKVETKILMDRAVYDLSEKKLISRSRATIEQGKKFKMMGDRMIFNAESQNGTMNGNVKTIIFGVGKSAQNAAGG